MVQQLSLPGDISEAYMESRLDVYNFAGGKLHLFKNRNRWGEVRSFCGKSGEDSSELVFFGDERICQRCLYNSTSYFQRLPMPSAVARAAIVGDDDSEFGCLVRADYLARCPSENEKKVAEAIQCYWMVRSQDETLHRKLLLNKRMWDLIVGYYEFEERPRA